MLHPKRILEKKKRELVKELDNLKNQKAEAVLGLRGINAKISRLQEQIQLYQDAIDAILSIEQ